jgi:hypothetical protein
MHHFLRFSRFISDVSKKFLPLSGPVTLSSFAQSEEAIRQVGCFGPLADLFNASASSTRHGTVLCSQRYARSRLGHACVRLNALASGTRRFA